MAGIGFMRLWDIYSPLLTPTQREITDMYFNLDLTVSEIAEQKGISRQGVSECLSSAKKQLEEYEGKLGFSRILREGEIALSLVLTRAGRWAEKCGEAHPELRAETEELRRILGADYFAEAARLCKSTDKE